MSDGWKGTKEFVQPTSGRSPGEVPAQSLQVGMGLVWLRKSKEARGCGMSNGGNTLWVMRSERWGRVKS